MARIPDKLAAGTTLSFEFFPPKTAVGNLMLGHAVAELSRLRPDFASITYGAGGSDRHRTSDVVGWMQRETPIEPMAHLTCVGHTRADVAELLVGYREAGVENILALGGDPPADGQIAGDYSHAIELVDDVAATEGFAVGVAAHPECHPRSPSRTSDRRHLAAKLRVADFAITQFFFDIEHYLRLVDELAELGVDKPVIAGVMPVTDAAQVRRMAQLSGADVPRWLTDRLDAAANAEEVRRIGIDTASQLCSDLVAAGAPGLHLYTLNRADVAKQIHANLGLVAV